MTEMTSAERVMRVLERKEPGRGSAEQITLFKSVGVAVQEAAAARAALMTAEQAGLGTVVPW